MNTSQTASAIGALVSAVLAVIAGVDPGNILAKPDIQAEVLGVFTAAVPLGLALWAYFHHSAALAAAQQKPDLNKLRV